VWSRARRGISQSIGCRQALACDSYVVTSNFACAEVGPATEAAPGSADIGGLRVLVRPLMDWTDRRSSTFRAKVFRATRTEPRGKGDTGPGCEGAVFAVVQRVVSLRSQP
jgi:hypothetical protein